MNQVIKKPVDMVFAKALMGPDLSEDERQIIDTLMESGDNEVTAIIPDDIDFAELGPMLSASVKAHKTIGDAQKKLKPILGQMFRVIEKRDDIQQALGCKNFTDFIQRYVPEKLHMPGSEAWACLRLARDYEDMLTVATYEEVGAGNMKLIAKAFPKEGGELTPSVRRIRQEFLEAAKGKKVAEVAKMIEERGYAEKEQLLPTKVYFHADVATQQEWKQFVSDPAIQAYCGTKDHAKIFSFMMAECRAAWQSHVASEE